MLTGSNAVAKASSDRSLVSLKMLFFDPITQVDHTFWRRYMPAFRDDASKQLPEIIPILRDKYGNSALHIAEITGACRIAKSLCSVDEKLMVDKNKFGQTPAHFAVFHQSHIGKYDRSILLIQDHLGFSPFHVASAIGDPSIIEYALLAKTPLKGNIYNATPLHWALKNDYQDSKKRIKKLITAQTLIQYSKSDDLFARNAVDLSPIEWAEMTMTSQEIDFIRGPKNGY